MMAHRGATATATATAAALALALALTACGRTDGGDARERAHYAPPAGSLVTRLAARARPGRMLVVEAATDVTFMRPFLTDFQARHPEVGIVYVDMLSNSLLGHALDTCARHRPAPDLYVSVATDHLVRLANDGCAARADLGPAVAPWREWRNEVFAFALEPAVFVYNRRLLPADQVPRGHLSLVEALRRRPAFWQRRIGTYDIRQSGLAFNYAEWDSHEASMFGRLIESLGRSEARLFCCSTGMVSAVERGDVLLAYNVQLSYAYAAQRRHPEVGVVLPDDFQAVQTRSAMIPAGARDPELGAMLLAYLLSPAAKRIEEGILSSPEPHGAGRFDFDPKLLTDADVSSALLRLQDGARRRALVQEWTRAVLPPRDAPAAAGPATGGS